MFNADEARILKKLTHLLYRKIDAGENGYVINNHGNVNGLNNIVIVFFDLRKGKFIIERCHGRNRVVTAFLGNLRKFNCVFCSDASDLCDQYAPPLIIVGNSPDQRFSLFHGKQKRFCSAAIYVKTGNALRQQ